MALTGPAGTVSRMAPRATAPITDSQLFILQRNIIRYLGSFMMVGIISTTWLVYWQADASSIAIIAGMTGTALGALGGGLVIGSVFRASADPAAQVSAEDIAAAISAANPPTEPQSPATPPAFPPTYPPVG